MRFNKSSTDNIDDESLESLRALLQNEVHPIYSCGRTYVSNLTKWRTHLDSRGVELSNDGSNVDAEVASANKSAHHYGEQDDIEEESSTSLNANVALATHNQHPDILLQWRAQIIAYYFEFTGYNSNTALVALSYLDAYSMSVLYPEEFASIKGENNNVEYDVSHSRANAYDTSVTPSPKKKRKLSNCYNNRDNDDYLYEYVENLIGQEEDDEDKAEEVQSVHGIDNKEYQLAAITSLYLATKLFQSSPYIITSSQFSYLSREFSKSQIECMESYLLNIVLEYRVHTPTSLRCIQEILPLLINKVGRYANDSSAWEPQNHVEESIYLNAQMFAKLGNFCDASNYPVIVSAAPSKIALAAIVEASDRVYFKEKLIVEQHFFYQRLFSLQVDGLAYDAEVREIQKCLVELRRLNELRGSRDGSPATVNKSLAEEGSSLSTTDDKENVQVMSTPSKNADTSGRPASSAVIRCAVNQSSSSSSSRQYVGQNRAA